MSKDHLNCSDVESVKLIHLFGDVALGLMGMNGGPADVEHLG